MTAVVGTLQACVGEQLKAHKQQQGNRCAVSGDVVVLKASNIHPGAWSLP